MKFNKSLIWLIVVMVASAVATSGCATRRYVRNQVAPVNQKLAVVQKETNDKIAATWSKLESDMSQVSERFSTTDQKIAQVADTAQQAQGTASRAMETSDTNTSAISANTTAISDLKSGVANALNYKLVDSKDVTFGFGKASLTPEAKATLDEVASTIQSQPRVSVELAGFTDPIGSASYNLALSRRRAEAVQRYLVAEKVPLRNIHIVGMGKEAAPPGMEKEIGPNPTKAELHRMARRVRISVFGAGDITEGAASRSQE